MTIGASGAILLSVPVALSLFLITAPAFALSEGQLRGQVSTERAQYEKAMRELRAKRRALRDLKERLAACESTACVAKQQRAVEQKQAAVAASLASALRQADEYVDREAAYRDRTGAYLDGDSTSEARALLKQSRRPPAGPNPGSPPPTHVKAGCVDAHGLPCVGEGVEVQPSAGQTPKHRPPAPAPTDSDGATGERRTAPESGRPPASPGGETTHRLGSNFASDEDAARLLLARTPALARSGGSPSARAGLHNTMPGGARRARLEGGSSAAAELLDAQLRLSEGDWTRAEEAARRAVALDPDNAAAHKALAIALLYQGKNSEALQAAERAAELDSSDAEAQMIRAFALEGLGRTDEMMEALERATELDARFLPYLELARKGRVLFSRRHAARGWRGFAYPEISAPGAEASPAPDGRKSLVAIGGLLVAAAAAILGLAAWRNRRRGRRSAA